MKHALTLPLLAACAATLLLSACAGDTAHHPAATPKATAQAADPMAWWRDARFGMFIHWSPSSVKGLEIGWDRNATRPLETVGKPVLPRRADPVYDALPAEFNPVAYDPAQWVKLAKDAGMGYMVFTTKHHDGFAMWPTKARADHHIGKTPWKNGQGDVLRDLADAAHAAHMRLGWYYSPRDWTNPDYGVGDNAKYEAFMETQVTELLSNYGKIDLLWWDSFGKGDSVAYWHAPKFNALARRLQPGIVINDRCNYYHEKNKRKDLLADFDTPEQIVGKYQIDRPWESCITLVAEHWSFRPGGHMMNADAVVRTLVSCATGDGNLLLNVGPMADGRIEPRQADVLRQVGQWWAKNGQTIRGTRGGPFKNGKWGGATFHGDTVYLHLLPQAPETLLLPPLGLELARVENLTGGTAQVKEENGRLRVTLPKDGRTGPDTIVALTFKGAVKHVAGTVAFPATK